MSHRDEPSPGAESVPAGEHGATPDQPNVGDAHRCRCYPIPDQVKQPKMVGWFDLGQLFSTGVQVLISSALGTRVDARLLEGYQKGGRHTAFTDLSAAPGGEIWFDYTADVGDGFQPTYLIAHALARTSVQPAGVARPLPRGRFLVLGGDEVYPAASRRGYQERLLAPYQLAWDQVYGQPHQRGEPPRDDVQVFAVPGNHDWYDGLVAFSRLFCQDPDLKQRYVGDWKSRQRRSYFAIKLPQHWWLWAVDIQLESDIDEGQLAYFAQLARLLQPGDRVILCTAEPTWAYAPEAERGDTNLDFLIRSFIAPSGATVHLTLAGDLHHYRHHQSMEVPDRHRIICGGGGAFLHPTHNVPAESGEIHCGDGRYIHRQSFPTAIESAGLARGLWVRFIQKNLSFCLVMGILYVLLVWGIPRTMDGNLLPPLEMLLHEPAWFLGEVSALTWLMLLGVPTATALIAKGQTATRRGFVAFGALHGLLHCAVALALVQGLTASAISRWGSAAADLLPGMARLAAFYVLSVVLAGVIFGQYLWASLAFFRGHPNEAFSALASDAFKSFLRLHITPRGDLEIYPIGIRQVVSHPCDAHLELIEDRPGAGPIVIASAMAARQNAAS